MDKKAQGKKNLGLLVPIWRDSRIVDLTRREGLKINKKTKSQIGKASKAAGRRFELKVRKDLESKGWVVSKWMNNVETVPIMILDTDKIKDIKKFKKQYKKYKKYPIIINREVHTSPRLVPAKHKFQGVGRPMSIGTGFPDFIAFRIKYDLYRVNGIKPDTKEKYFVQEDRIKIPVIIGVEVKSNGYLTKEEKEKCRWLIANNIFSKILIASKGKKRGEIKYQEVKNNGKKDI